MLTVLLCAAAFVAGLTGSWSPCGFSMISTIGEHGGSTRLKLAACAAFVPGALAGGALTFGLAALAGSLLGGATVAIAFAAVVAAVGAVAEGAGVKIAPQIRRQVPESWRRTWPLPLAVAAYGVLLGLGFTTFVLTFAVPALTAVALGVGDLGTGLAMGLAFGAGRALPVVTLAPFATAPAGVRATELMAERPGILRGFRTADALALAACAIALAAGGAPAQAATTTLAAPAADPSAAGTDLAWALPGGTSGYFTQDGRQVPLQAAHPAVGGDYLAVIADGQIRVARRADGQQVLALPAPRADAVAVSNSWVVYRRAGTHQQLVALPLTGGAERVIAQSTPPVQVGRPALDGARVVFHVAGRRASRIDEVDLATGRRRALRRSSLATFSNPSMLAGRLLYVETTFVSQTLRLGTRTSKGGRALLTIAPAITWDAGKDPGGRRYGEHAHNPKRPRKTGPKGSSTTLWTTALAPDAAYVTRLVALDGRTDAAILRVAR
jgi:hypothetical protein